MDDVPKDGKAKVLVFRNATGEPIAVPADIVTEAERAYRCYQMRIGGMAWSEISILENYPSPGAAKYDVDRYMAEAKALVVEASARDMLTLEVHRLDALQHAMWDAAMAGDTRSGSLVMGIIINRAKLIGLDPEKMADDADRARTVVIPMEEQAYMAALQKAANDSDDTELTPRQ